MPVDNCFDNGFYRVAGWKFQITSGRTAQFSPLAPRHVKRVVRHNQIVNDQSARKAPPRAS
jgi:hypothetical protein